MPEAQDIPQKPTYKTSEVCQYTDTQPYVLRFWESEFPQLRPDTSRGGQPVYSRRDIDLVLRIKELLYDKEFSIADARQRLEQDAPAPRAVPKQAKPPEAPRPRKTAPVPQPPPIRERPAPRRELDPQETFEFDSVPRERYEDAVDEISHLRLQLKEAEARARKAEAAHRKAEETSGRWRTRCDRAVATFERLLEMLN